MQRSFLICGLALCVALLGCNDRMINAVGHESASIGDSTIELVDSAPTSTVKGHVVDAKTGDKLPGTTVSFPEHEQGTAADGSGTFRIEDVPQGAHHLVAKFLGYHTAETSVDLTENGVYLRISLDRKPEDQLGDIIVLKCFPSDSKDEGE